MHFGASTFIDFDNLDDDDDDSGGGGDGGSFIIITIIIIINPLEFFTSASADAFSLEFEWQQASSSVQDPSQYSGRLQ